MDSCHFNLYSSTYFLVLSGLSEISGVSTPVCLWSFLAVLLWGPLRKFLSSLGLLSCFGPNFESSLPKVYNLRYKPNSL